MAFLSTQAELPSRSDNWEAPNLNWLPMSAGLIFYSAQDTRRALTWAGEDNPFERQAHILIDAARRLNLVVQQRAVYSYLLPIVK